MISDRARGRPGRPQACAPDRARDGARQALGIGLAAVLTLAAAPAIAQVSIEMGGESLTLRTVQLFVLLTLLSLAPGLAIMVT